MFRKLRDWFRSKRAHFELLTLQQQTLAAQDAALMLLHKRYEDERRSHLLNLATLLSVLGGEVVVSNDLINSVFSFEGVIDVEIIPQQDGTTRLALIMEEEEVAANE